MDVTDKFDKSGDTLKAKNYLYNAIQTFINATAINDNTAVILKTIFFLNHNLKLRNESSKTEITKDIATEVYNITEGSESEPSEHVNITEASEKKATDPSESEVTELSEN